MYRFLALIVLCLPIIGKAQIYENDSINLALDVEKPDSADVARLQKKSFWRASAEVFGMNMGLWAFDRYVQKGHYAYISINTIKENFRHGFEWDDDFLGTNMFAHPYNGSIFYNAGRSNGYNFWQSTLFGIGGSAMWEMFMECEYPSTNDIIATPIGGAAIGEVLYRSADLILDDRSYGGERFGRELAAFIVSPMRGFTRIITGRASEHRATSGRRYGVPPITFELNMGARVLAFRNNKDAAAVGGTTQIEIEYGDRYEESTKEPYDYFSFLLELNAIKSQPLLSRVEIIGRLLSKEIIDTKDLKLSLGMYQHFDYFDSDTISERHDILEPSIIPYKFGTPASIGGGAMARIQANSNWEADAYAHLNAVILAGILNDYYHVYNRDYSWGGGGALKLGLDWRLKNDALSASIAYQFYRIYTRGRHDSAIDAKVEWNGHKFEILGSNSNSTFRHIEAKLKCRLYKNLYILGGVDFYRRVSNYTDMKVIYEGGSASLHPKKISRQIGLQLMLSYTF